MHAGEGPGTGANVASALQLRARRVAHGLALAADPVLLAKIVDSGRAHIRLTPPALVLLLCCFPRPLLLAALSPSSLTLPLPIAILQGHGGVLPGVGGPPLRHRFSEDLRLAPGPDLPRTGAVPYPFTHPPHPSHPPVCVCASGVSGHRFRPPPFPLPHRAPALSCAQTAGFVLVGYGKNTRATRQVGAARAHSASGPRLNRLQMIRTRAQNGVS